MQSNDRVDTKTDKESIHFDYFLPIVLRKRKVRKGDNSRLRATGNGTEGEKKKGRI